MKKVLIIEDEQDIVDIATMILEDEGYEVSSHCEYADFETKVNDSHADLVLLDLNLDGYHGKDICKYIKSNDHLKDTSVILMSANRDIAAIKEEAGADGYITKPFDLVDFINIVKTFINKRQLAQAS
ncbi:MAG TPA: response regulator [Mucilaginibacter sp.]|jgi:two-component system cell cycle response regulator DivK|nr:response regulator [Mucilaginibacter sp.]